jgi:DNA-directed RNA polymerase subunit RPC12/RpoP
MYECERCGARFHSKRAASLEVCPRCLLRDDVASHLVQKERPRDAETPDAAGGTADSGQPKRA